MRKKTKNIIRNMINKRIGYTNDYWDKRMTRWMKSEISALDRRITQLEGGK